VCPYILFFIIKNYFKASGFEEKRKDFFEKEFIKEKIGADVAGIADLIIYEDTCIEVFYPPEIKKELEKFYAKTKKIEDMNTNKIFEKLWLKKTEIQIIIHKNKELAEQLEKQTKNYFKSKKPKKK
jgi:hypothetical protein